MFENVLKAELKYVNKAEIISKVTITLSLINSPWIKISILLVELSKLLIKLLIKLTVLSFTLWKNTWFNSVLTLVKIVLASLHKNNQTNHCQDFLGIEYTYSDAALCKWVTRAASDLSFKNFCKLAKLAETIRNYAKKDFGYESFLRKLRN